MTDTKINLRNTPRFRTNDEFSSVTVHVQVLQDEALTPNQKILFSFILAGYQGSQKKLGSLVGIDQRTVGNNLVEMSELGYITVIRKGLYNMYRVEAPQYQHLVAEVL
ncbi:hypothetical protein AB6Q85_003300 [Vibrio cholerae]